MAKPCGFDIGCNVSSITQGELEKFAKQLLEGANETWAGFFTSWIGSGLDGIVGGSTADWFAGVALPIQALLLALGLMVAGIRIAMSARGDIAADAGRRFLRAVLVSIAGVAFFSVLQVGSNALAKFFLNSATAGAPPSLLFDVASFSSNGAMALLFGIFAALAVGIQWIIMILRAVAVSVLLPFWPIAASGAMFDKYEAMFEKTTGWLLAFLLYSPVAAALYGLAMRFQQGRDGVEGVMVGLAVFVLAIFALPALMRLVVPLTSAMGRASAGGMAAGAGKSAVIAGVAVGSVVMTAGATAPAVAAKTGAAASGSSAFTGATAAAGSSRTTGGAPSAGGSRGGSPRSGWDTARDLGHQMPTGSRGVGELIDE